ncbi:MAG: carboxypeptidase-like regulatory domain-containing protein [Bryobacteraceae bacterium]
MNRFLFIALAVFLMVSVSFGQRRDEDSNTRSVQGTVTDATDNIVNGAVVKLKDSKTLHIRSFITKQDGKFHFHGLNPDIDYELKAEYQGASSDTKTLSTFDSRKRAVINLKLESK